MAGNLPAGSLPAGRGAPDDLVNGLVSGPADAAPGPAAPEPAGVAREPAEVGPPAFDLDLDFAFRSDLDRALTWYRDELALRRLVGILALPALLALAGFGMMTAPGAVPWLVAVLAFLAAAEIAWTTTRLRRRR